MRNCASGAGTHTPRRSFYRRYPTPALLPIGRSVWVPAPDAQLRIWAGTTWWISGFNFHTVGYSQTCLRDLAAHFARVLSGIFRPLENRGRRESRMRAAPAVSRAICTKESAHEHTGSAENIRPSLRNGFTVSFVLSPVNGFVATVIPEKLASQELDASIGASGPHDFAVRISRARQSQLSRPPHPTARFVTIASRPSCRVRRAERGH
jgi:hypothetical protein